MNELAPINPVSWVTALMRDLLNPAVSIDEILVRCRGRFPEKPPDPDPNLILLLGALPVFFLWRI